MTTITSDRDIAIEVGARIQNLMWRKRITQEQLGGALDVNQSTAGKKIRGVVGITIPELLKIALLLEVDVVELLPRLDSNQRPFGYGSPQVSGGARGGLRRGVDWVLAA